MLLPILNTGGDRMIGFLIGFMLGGFVGICIMAMMRLASDADDRMHRD